MKHTEMVEILTGHDIEVRFDRPCALQIDGETISGGVSLTPNGYQNLTLNGKVLEGSAWISVTKDNMGDYNF